jgi:rhamnose transport system permease protein
MSFAGGRLVRAERLKELTLLVVIVVTVLLFNPFVDDYISGRFFNRVTTSVSIIAVLAVAQTLVIITRNIDLSVGSIVGITAYTTGQFVGAHPDLTPAAGVALAIAIGTGLGLVNGVLVAYGRVPSIVVTLGTLAIYRSFLIEYAEARTITTDTLPRWVQDLPRDTVASLGDLDLRLVFVIGLLVVLVLQVAVTKLRWGRWLYAIGSNPDAARQMGLPHRRLVLSAFVGSGALAGLAGFLFLARFGTINVTAGQGFELDSVAAAVVGGASILGGVGTFVGALLGAVLIDLLDQSLVRVEAVTEFYRNAILGALILLAVIGDAALGRRLRRRRATEARPVDAAPEPTEPAPTGAASMRPVPIDADPTEEASRA